MTVQNFCPNERRRDLVKSDPAFSTLNGIDYAQVLDDPAWDAEFRKQIIVVKMIRPIDDGYGEDSFIITSSTGGPDITVLHAGRGDTGAAFFPDLPSVYKTDQYYILQTESTGDYTNYTLSLVNGAFDHRPMYGFDPSLAEVELSPRSLNTSSQYFCSDERRREVVRSTPALSAINGIDYLEVLDDPSWPMQYRQRILVVTLLRAVPSNLGVSNLHITGGTRIPEINVLQVAIGSNNSAVNAIYAGIPAEYRNDHNLIIYTDSNGDFSNYSLAITRSNIDLRPRPDFDAHLSTIDFSLKVECASDFDCKPVSTCEPEPLDEPLLDYLTKDFNSFRQLMLDRLAVTLPDWKERNASDIGTALVEVLAYAADYLSYYQDAVSTEAYIGTARKRVSMRRHARLLNYPMHDGSNARVWIDLSITGSAGVTLPKGTPLLTRVNKYQGTAALSIGTVDPDGDREKILIDAVNQGAEVYETLHNATLYSAHNQIAFYTWLDESCCLPKGATRATLVDDLSNRVRLRVGDILVFEEARSSETGQTSDADPSKRHAVRITAVNPEASVEPDIDGFEDRTPSLCPLIDPVSGTAIVEIEWAREDALPFPLCLSTMVGTTSYEDLAIARGNIVLADHGRTIHDEPLLPDTVPDSGIYRPQLRRSSVTHAVPYDQTVASKLPAVEVLTAASSSALAAVTLDSGSETWVARRDLLASDRFATDVVVETESDGISVIRFGDDVLGRRPVPSEQFTATYRVGNGHVGNVGPGAIAHIVTDRSAYITGVVNPLPAVGGTDPEDIENVRLYAPQAFRVNKRAVTKADYSEMAQRHPEVQAARATIRWTGSWATAYISIDRKGGLPVDDAFKAEILAFMEQFRLMGRDMEINGPKFVPISIKLEVCVEPGYFASNVKAALMNVMSNRVLPDGTLGLFHPDNFTFNQTLYLSQVISAAMAVPGVAYVTPKVFRRAERDDLGQSLADAKIEMARLEVVRLDNDPNRPENGKIEFITKGGL